MSTDFYRAFEDRHRGSRELILGRLEVYLPFVEQLKEVHNACTALDLGCGRGEWLELLQRHGVDARGVDLDEGMLRACRERELNVEQRDAIETLQSLPDSTLSVVSGFHIVEHIDFDQLQQLVTQSLRVLRPGGLLILESPNAENLAVGSHNFFLDPTHIRPMPHMLLAFVTEYAGFVRSKLLRLQEAPELHADARPSLKQVLSGVSPDYAIVAQKSGNPETLNQFEPLFEKEYGVSLDHVADLYQKALDAQISSLSNRIAEAQRNASTMTSQVETLTKEAVSLARRCGELESKLEHAQAQFAEQQSRAAGQERRLAELTRQINDSLANAHHWHTRASAAEQRAADILASTSWRITAPLRALRRLVGWLLALPIRALKACLRPLLAVLMRNALRRPALRQRIADRLRAHPRLFAHLRQFAVHRGLLVTPSALPPTSREPAPSVSQQDQPVPTEQEPAPGEAHLMHLTPRARKIYADLKTAIEKNQKGPN